MTRWPKVALEALVPRPRGRVLGRAPALEALDADLDLVGSWCLRAIARAWDSRRIGYANDGQHPFELEVAAILGISKGHAVDHVAAAEQRVAELEPRCRAARRARAPRSPLAALAREFRLSAAATDALLVIAAPALRGELARLYGILGNDEGRPLVDELLVGEILGATAAGARHALARELDLDRPLRRFGLVRQDAGQARPFAALSVDAVVLARLRRRPVAAALGTAVTVIRAPRPLEELLLPDAARGLVRELRAPARAPVRLIVRGRPGSGRRTLLAALAARARRRLAVIDVAILPAEPAAFVGALREALARAWLAGHLPCVSGLDAGSLAERAIVDPVREALRAHPGPIAFRLRPEVRPPLDPGYLEIDLPLPAETERRELWRRGAAASALAVDEAALASRYRVTPGVIHRALAQVACASAGGDATLALAAAIRQTLDDRLTRLATRVTRLASWEQVVLPADVQDTLREIVARVRHRRVVFEEWGFDLAIGSARGLTALFQGGPGTGKSMVAGALARELGLELYRVDLSRVLSKWLGETERNLAEVFDAAEEGHVMLLFDEADSLFAKRTEVKSSNDRYANLAVNYLLTRLDSFDGIAILTTNFSSIDAAFRRRMAFRVTFPLPDEEMRLRLWRAHLPAAMPVDGELGLETIADKYSLSGGYIRNAALRAAFLAARDGRAVSDEHVLRAVELEYRDFGKLSANGTME
jgi:ATP-dependent 26S proteasome regulatory subunit